MRSVKWQMKFRRSYDLGNFKLVDGPSNETWRALSFYYHWMYYSRQKENLIRDTSLFERNVAHTRLYTGHTGGKVV